MGDFSAITDSIAEMASVLEGGSRVRFAKRIRTKVDRPESLQHRLLSFSRSARIFLYVTVASGFIVVAIAVVQALLLSDVVSQVFTEDQTLSDVKSILWIMLAFAVLRAAIVWGGDLTVQRSASHLKGCLRDALTKHLFALGPAYSRGERSGELVNTTVRGVEDLDEYMSLFLPLRFMAVVVPIFIALVVLIIDPLTVVILLVTGPVLVLLLALIGGRAKEVTERRFVELGWMSAFFLDMLQGLATLKMFGRSREQVANVQGISRNYGSATMQVLRTAFETALVLEWSTTIATALVAVEVSLRLMTGALPFNQALALLIITPEFFFPLRQLALRYHAGAAGKTAAERIFTILDTPLPHQFPPKSSSRPILDSRIDIRIEHVDCSYDNGRRPALRNFSLNISHSQRVALIGETGAGKTTVANLLLRFVEPDSGSITINGTSLNSIDPIAWRSHIAWVPQHAHLFYGTIADNIRIANPDATDDEVVSVATAAHAHDFIAELPLGYDTPIGENGARLSGGERQRLAIARAFLKDAPLLILDEATSHLDSENEAMVLDALDRLSLGRTVLIIAHRMNLVRNSDLIVVMHQGRVVEAGTSHVHSAHDAELHQLVAVHNGAVL
jgi:ATP-binding cassette, subfamily C, bacterial CydD